MATAAVEQTYTPPTYNHRAYDSLPELNVAAHSLEEHGGAELLKSCIRFVYRNVYVIYLILASINHICS